MTLRSLHPFSILLFAAVACQREEGDLEQHAEACAQQCAAAHDECASDPTFADPWTLSCEVACNFDFMDETQPFATCMDAAATCAAKDACLGGPSVTTFSSDSSASDPTNASEPTDPTADPSESTGGMTQVDPSDPTIAEDTGELDTSSGGEEVPPCCGDSCADLEITDCACYHMPSCCGGAWDELCVNAAVANDCIETGCPSLAGEVVYDCTCETSSVYCPDDPFVAQIYFSPEVCAADDGSALVTAAQTSEVLAEDCEITQGSLECTCTATADVCGTP
jgi:hypothetical protein